MEIDGHLLVFGLEWFPLLGGHLGRQADTFARRRRASFRVLTTGAAASVGLLAAKPRRSGKLKLLSAAAAFAAMHPSGTVATVLTLPSGRHWLVAVHEAAIVARTDQLFDHHTEVHQALKSLRQAHPSLLVHEVNDIADPYPELAAKALPHGRLVRVRPGLVSMPGLAVAVVICVVGAFTWRHTSATSDRMVEDVPTDPRVAWQAAISNSAGRYLVHGVAGTQAVLNAMLSMPVSVAGWTLRLIDCLPAESAWRCEARFQRTPATTNEDFLGDAKSEWAVSFDPLEGARVTWSVPMAALRLNAISLHTGRRNDAQLLSALQALRPAFTDMHLEAAQALPVRAPLDAQQRPVPRPIGLPGYQRRAIRLQAPLRSLFVLLPETTHMAWERIGLQVSPVDQPSLRSSQFRVSLSGVLYEMDDAHELSVVPNRRDLAKSGGDIVLDDTGARG